MTNGNGTVSLITCHHCKRKAYKPNIRVNRAAREGWAIYCSRECSVLGRSATHRDVDRPAYGSWRGMLDRCRCPNHNAYKYYGARGISVCKRWLTFANFLADMGERPPGRSLDRVDNDGNYEPTNCRWATFREQTLNRRQHVLNACRRGHPYATATTYIRPNGIRECLICVRAKRKQWYLEKGT